MGNKVILVSIDGMRPDGLMNCGNAYVDELLKTSAATMIPTARKHPRI